MNCLLRALSRYRKSLVAVAVVCSVGTVASHKSDKTGEGVEKMMATITKESKNAKQSANSEEKTSDIETNQEYELSKVKICKELGISSEEFNKRINSGEGVAVVHEINSESKDEIYSSEFIKKYPITRVNLSTFQQKNTDVVGWLRMPVLGIDEPAVISKNGDYNYYLEHDIDNKDDRSGCIELDYRSANSIIGVNDNSILYGHNMITGDKFGKLKDLLNENVQNEIGSDFIEYMNSDKSGLLLKIGSIFITDENDSFYSSVYSDLSTPEAVARLDDDIRKRNIVPKFNFEGTSDVKGYVILSTCYGVGDNGKRLVAVAKQVSSIGTK